MSTKTPSNAIARGMQRDADGKVFEMRVFKRPDGNYSWASYPDEQTPDDQPSDGPNLIAADHADMMIRMCTDQKVDLD